MNRLTTTGDKNDARLLAYAVAAGAALAVAGPADASVVYSGIKNVAVDCSISSPITVVLGSIEAVNFSAKFMGYKTNANKYKGSVGRQGTQPVSFAKKTGTGSVHARNFANQNPIGASSGFTAKNARLFKYNNGFTANAQFTAVNPGYLGFKVSTGTPVYGWIQIDPISKSSYTVKDWAYQADGSAILAGDTGTAVVPEPTSSALALIAMGAGGLAIYRRRQQEKPAA